MKIILGSTNEAKEKAVRMLGEELIPEDFEIDTVEIEEAPDQPVGLEEAREGALLRAENALMEERADLGVGIEGFIQSIDGDYYLSCFAAITDGESVGFGTSGLSRLNKEMQEELPEKELGEVIVEFMGEDLREGKGAIGVLTDGEIGRPGFSYRSLIHAYSDLTK